MPTPKKPTTETITFLNLTIHPQNTLNQAITRWIKQNQTTLNNITNNITKKIYRQETTNEKTQNTQSYLAETIMLMIHNHRTHPTKMLDCKNIAAYIHRNTNSRTRHARDKLETPASGMTAARRRQREAQHTIHQLANKGIQNPTIDQIIQHTNQRLRATRKNPENSAILLTKKDFKTNWTQNTTLEEWNQPTTQNLDNDTLTQIRIQLAETLPKLANQWLETIQHPGPYPNQLTALADPLFRAITSNTLTQHPTPQKTGITTLNLITLNAHAGTLTYGHARAGLHPILAIDSDPRSLKTTSLNLNIPVISPQNPQYKQHLAQYTAKPYILAAQPTNNEHYQHLTQLAATHQPYLIMVWENPHHPNPDTPNILQKHDYTTNTVTIYTPQTGVPLNQYWLITIAALNPKLTTHLTQTLETLKQNPILSLKDYWPTIPLDAVYKRSRHGSCTTPVTRPHPALPDKQRHKPKNYTPHPNDTPGRVRALTNNELARILSIPDTYRLPKQCYGLLRGCIPPKTGWTIGSQARISVEKNQYILAA